MLEPADFAARIVPLPPRRRPRRRDADPGAAGDDRRIRPARAGARAAARRGARSCSASSSATRWRTSDGRPRVAAREYRTRCSSRRSARSSSCPRRSSPPPPCRRRSSRALIEGLGLKPRVAYGPLRVALSGRRISPPLFESMELLGKAESIRRLGALVDRIGLTRSVWLGRAASSRLDPWHRLRPSALGYGVIGNTEVSGTFVLGSSPGTPAVRKPPFSGGFSFPARAAEDLSGPWPRRGAGRR